MRRKLAPKSCALPGFTLSQSPEFSRACSASSCSRSSSSVSSWGSAVRSRPLPRLPVSVLMPAPPLRAGIRRSARYVSHVSRSSSCVPMPTMPPSSSTMMRSASVMVETRCATTILVTSGNSRHNACLSLASVVRSSAENESSKTRMSGRCTIARAIASRWRWPPDTLVPPWAMRPFEAALHVGDEVAALRDLERVPELGVGGLLAAEPQVGGHGAGEEEGALRHEADGLPEPVEVGLAHVDAVHVDRAARGVEQSRDQRDERRLARAGGADDRDGLAAARRGTRCPGARGARRRGRRTRRPSNSTVPTAGNSADRAARAARAWTRWRAPR